MCMYMTSNTTCLCICAHLNKEWSQTLLCFNEAFCKCRVFHFCPTLVSTLVYEQRKNWVVDLCFERRWESNRSSMYFDSFCGNCEYFVFYSWPSNVHFSLLKLNMLDPWFCDSVKRYVQFYLFRISSTFRETRRG